MPVSACAEAAVSRAAAAARGSRRAAVRVEAFFRMGMVSEARVLKGSPVTGWCCLTLWIRVAVRNGFKRQNPCATGGLCESTSGVARVFNVTVVTRPCADGPLIGTQGLGCMGISEFYGDTDAAGLSLAFGDRPDDRGLGFVQ